MFNFLLCPRQTGPVASPVLFPFSQPSFIIIFLSAPPDIFNICSKLFERNDVLILNEYFLAILKALGATNNPRSSDVITLLRGFMWTQPRPGEKLCRNDTANCGKMFPTRNEGS